MNVIFDDETGFDLINKYSALLNNVIETTLMYELDNQSIVDKMEVSFLFVDNETIKELNNKFRSIDKETDVLSFPLIDFGVSAVELDKLDLICIGDIVISFEKCLQQSEDFGHTIQRELCFLTVHSVLHLLGYDHIEDGQRIEMEVIQQKILTMLKIER